MDQIKENSARWLNSPAVSDKDKQIIKAMPKENFDDAFYKSIEFGTAGMRGVLGPGTNRMNIFTVKRAAIAFANVLKEKFSDAREKGIVISHDNRHMSREFALESAKLFNELGLKAYLFDDLRPTPELSYAVRYLHCVGGVMITASHNPKEYNGYKVYDETGCQLVPEKIAPVLKEIAKYPDELSVSYQKDENPGKTIILDHNIDDDYVRACEAIQVHPELDKKGFGIVYTPQHGASYENAMRVFKDCGYEVTPVAEQCVHDPDFGATKSPNPEDPRAYEEPIKLAKKVNAELICMTDPDGDRVGLAYKDRQGSYRLLTGNESAALLIDYLLSEKKKLGSLPGNGILYDTIVTSRLGAKIAESYGIKVESLLTGFKFIGDAIARSEKTKGSPEYVFGYEESYGCLPAPFVRDKDGIQAILLYCEMALFHHLRGENLGEALEGVMQKYGYHIARQSSKMFVGPSGSASMNALMEKLHENPPEEISGKKVVRVEDYETSTYKEGRKIGKLTLPKSQVVKLILEDGSWAAIRPSGTEPKVKFYVEIVSKEKGDPDAIASKFVDDLKSTLGVED